ncbi:response regulator [Sphingomonas humi]|uniref:Response regulator n=2 Tax=Sphingomonas humi TaxID=335630 RepID=A0ABP7RFU2_9SPHN
MIAFALEDMVIELGYEVVGPAYRLPDALELAGREQFEAAVLDVNLNEQLSFPVADLLASLGIPFVFATGYAEGGVGWSGQAPVIAKPYGREQLARVLATLLP